MTSLLIRAAALAPNRLLTAEDISLGERSREPSGAVEGSLDEVVAAKVRAYLRSLGEVTPRDLHAKVLEIVERPLLEAVLDRTGGNQLRAAEILGINRNTLRKKITDLAIRLPKERL